jgi:pSer/pThr/pTyr-binding forkhead associated (FHA) protein
VRLADEPCPGIHATALDRCSAAPNNLSPVDLAPLSRSLMAILHDERSGKNVPVAADLLVGRSPSCGLRLEEPYVSGHHATLRWVGSVWQLKDLGSRNGTLLNGTRVASGRPYDLKLDDRLGFGHESEQWQLTDAGPPATMIIPLAGGDPLIVQEQLLALPDAMDPQITLFHDPDGRWMLETVDGVAPLQSSDTFQVAGRAFRFSCPDTVSLTTTVMPASSGRRLKLVFAVSRDEEHVELRARMGSRTIELGARAHNYLLLTLARARLADTKEGTVESSSGWVYQEELLDALRVTATQLNIDVFRIRQHFARAGLHDLLNVVERRPRTKQLRIGTGALEINVL